MLFLYGALLHSSVVMVLCCLALVSPLLEVCIQTFLLQQSSMADAQRIALLGGMGVTGGHAFECLQLYAHTTASKLLIQFACQAPYVAIYCVSALLALQIYCGMSHTVCATPLVAVAELVLDPVNSWLSFMLIGLWALIKAAELLWRALKEDRTLGGLLPGEVVHCPASAVTHKHTF